MADDESLIATRKRRSNAGSRLKQLLKAEEVANEGDEDDNDIDLLFQEDDDDAEFNVGDKDRYGYQGSDEDDQEESEDEQREASDEESQREGTTSTRENGTDSENDEESPQVDNDDMFSDSEDDDSDEDDSDAGEKELQKQERVEKRQAQKKARQIPKIISKPKATAPKKKIQHVEPKAETLLSLSRRQSSRKTAVQNKMDLVSRLKENEARRQSVKPVARVEYVELTQEERLAEAIETEKYNISTLNKYKEQEVDKKKKQRALQLSKRKRLENVVSYKTCPIFVTPVEEHELEHFLMTRDTIRRKRDRRGRKSEKQKREEEEARKKDEARKKRAAMFIIQPKSPAHSPELLKKLQDEGMDIKQLHDADRELKPKVEMDPLELPDSSVPPESRETTIEPSQNEPGAKDETQLNNDEKKKRPLSSDSAAVEEHDSKRAKVDNIDAEADDEILLVEPKSTEAKTTDAVSEEEGGKEEIKEKEDEEDAKSSEDSKGANATEPESVEKDSEGLKPEASTEQDATTDIKDQSDSNDKEAEDTTAVDKMDVDSTDLKVKNEQSDEKASKTVKFADEEGPKTPVKVDDHAVSRETTLEPSLREPSIASEEPIMFEGPPQKVAANFISFEESTKHYTVDEIKAYLFGPQSLLPAQRRTQDVEPILRLRADAISEDDKIGGLQDLPSFEFLNNFPKFGEFNKVKKEQVVLETRQDIKVVLKTQPPTGVHLPNGSKKQCLLTGKPAMYFDPKTGLPYNSVESYKVIKDIQNGVWAWVEFPGGGSYVCNRENTVHAKGVPEGFDE